MLDIGLPVMDGYELARHLRDLPNGNRIKLIALTGYGQSSDVARAREAGFSDHLVKPASIEAIEAAIDSARSEALPVPVSPRCSSVALRSSSCSTFTPNAYIGASISRRARLRSVRARG